MVFEDGSFKEAPMTDMQRSMLDICSVHNVEAWVSPIPTNADRIAVEHMTEENGDTQLNIEYASNWDELKAILGYLS